MSLKGPYQQSSRFPIALSAPALWWRGLSSFETTCLLPLIRVRRVFSQRKAEPALVASLHSLSLYVGAPAQREGCVAANGLFTM
eukprot:1161882-Pelagomonas_calceolata.AAC.12